MLATENSYCEIAGDWLTVTRSRYWLSQSSMMTWWPWLLLWFQPTRTRMWWRCWWMAYSRQTLALAQLRCRPPTPMTLCTLEGFLVRLTSRTHFYPSFVCVCVCVCVCVYYFGISTYHFSPYYSSVHTHTHIHTNRHFHITSVPTMPVYTHTHTHTNRHFHT